MELNYKEDRRCLDCDEALEGRSDKKFCSVKHKNAYNNRQNRKKNSTYQKVDKQLHQNHKALQKFFELSNGKEFIDQKPLVIEGFDSRFYIGKSEPSASDEIYYLLYDYGFVINSSLKIKIVHRDGGFYNI